MSGADIAKQTSSPIEQGVLSTFCIKRFSSELPLYLTSIPFVPSQKKAQGATGEVSSVCSATKGCGERIRV